MFISTSKYTRTLLIAVFLHRLKNISVSACSQTFTADTGTFTSPNHPNNYPNHISCDYEIHPATDGTTLRLVFDIFETERRHDGIEVKDENGVIQFTVSGGRFTWMVLPSSKAFYLTFVSDGSVSREGFTATWSVALSSGFLDYRVAMAIGCSIRGEFRPAAPRNGIRKSEVIAIPGPHDCMLLCYNVPECLYFTYDTKEGECIMFEENAEYTHVYENLFEKIFTT